MKNLLITAILLISFTSYGQKEQSSILVGQKAPMFKAMDQNGKTIVLISCMNKNINSPTDSVIFST